MYKSVLAFLFIISCSSRRPFYLTEWAARDADYVRNQKIYIDNAADMEYWKAAQRRGDIGPITGPYK